MTIYVDQVRGHENTGTGDDTVPPGIADYTVPWCHIVSSVSLEELQTFLTDNLATIGCPATNVRTPTLGSNVTYAGLNGAQHDAAVTAGATNMRQPYVITHVFDKHDPPGTYEP